MSSQANRKKKKKGRGGSGGGGRPSQTAAAASTLASILNRGSGSAGAPYAPSHAAGGGGGGGGGGGPGAVPTAPPAERPETYTLIAKEVPHDMLPGLLAADPELLGATALRQRQLQGVPMSDVFIDFDHPPLRAPGAETPMLVQLRSFFPVYPFNYCDACLGRYHTGPCTTAQRHAHAPEPAGGIGADAGGGGGGMDDDDDDLPPLLDESSDSDEDDDDDDLPPLLDNSDLSDEEFVPPTRGSRGGAQHAAKAPASSSSSSTQPRGAAATGTKEEQPDGNYYDDYRYNPPLVYEQSISFITGKLPELRDFSRHRAAIFSFLMNHNVDVMQVNGIQPTTTGFKVLLASSFALRGFEHQSECVVPTLGKVKVELFNGYRTDAKPGWHDTGDDDFTDEEDYDDDGYYRQIPVDLRQTSTSKSAAKGAKAPAVDDDDDEPPPLLDCSSSEDEDDMPALDDRSDDESDDESDDDYLLARRPTRSAMKPPRSAIVNRFKEAQEYQKQRDAQQQKLERARRQMLEKQRQAKRRDDDEAAAIRFADLISGVGRHKEWTCARTDCKSPVIYHYEKHVKAKCEGGCAMHFHKSCWQEVVKSQAPAGAQAKGERHAAHCPECGARITSELLRINFGDKKKIYADEGLVAGDVEQAGAAKNGSEDNTDPEERKREWLATNQRREEEFKRRRDEAERKRREQEEIAKREDEERRQKRRQERKQRKREKDRKGEPQMGEMVVVGKAGERAQPKPKPAETGAPIDPTANINAAPDKVHVKKPERDVLPEAAKQDLERRRQRNAKKKQKKLEKRQAKSALRIYLDPSASPETGSADEGSISTTAAAEWPEEALRVAQSEGYQLPAGGRSAMPIVHPVTGEIVNQTALAPTAGGGDEEEDIWAVPAPAPTTTSHGQRSTQS